MAKRPAAKTPQKSAKAAADPVMADSLRGLAKLLGVTHTAVGKWMIDPRWQFGGGPWRKSQVAAIEIWRANELMERPTRRDMANDAFGAAAGEPTSLESLSPSKKADIALKIKRREVLDFALQIQKGKYHDVEPCRQARRRAIHEVKQALLDLPNSITTDEGTRTIIRGRVIELLRRFAKAMGEPEGGYKPPTGGDGRAAGAAVM
jgi:hypothetical protein